VHDLSNAEVLRLAHMQISPWQSRRLHELLEQQREGIIATEEIRELGALLRLHDSALLLKAEAMAEAVRRGLCAPGAPA